MAAQAQLARIQKSVGDLLNDLIDMRKAKIIQKQEAMKTKGVRKRKSPVKRKQQANPTTTPVKKRQKLDPEAVAAASNPPPPPPVQQQQLQQQQQQPQQQPPNPPTSAAKMKDSMQLRAEVAELNEDQQQRVVQVGVKGL